MKRGKRKVLHIKLLNLLMSAYYDLFSVPNWEPNPKDVENWLLRYKKKQKIKNS